MKTTTLVLGLILWLLPGSAHAGSPTPLPASTKGFTLKPAPGTPNVIVVETPIPYAVPSDAMIPPQITVREIHPSVGGQGGKQAVVRHARDKMDSTFQEGDEIEGWKVLSITDSLVTLEKKIDDRHAIRAQLPVEGVRQVPMGPEH